MAINLDYTNFVFNQVRNPHQKVGKTFLNVFFCYCEMKYYDKAHTWTHKMANTNIQEKMKNFFY